MSTYGIGRISFPGLMELKCAHTTYTYTPHYIQIKWVDSMCQIKCSIKFITRYTK